MLSVQVAGWQMPALQTPLWQSAEAAQTLPVLQAPQTPPQSTSVSVPLRWPSVHVGPWQAPLMQVSLLHVWQMPGR